MAWSEDVVARFDAYGWDTRAGRGRQRRRRDRGRDRGGPRRRPAEPDRRPDAHRLRQPEQAGQPEGPRRAARPGRGPPHQGGLRLGSGPDVLRARTRRSRCSARPSPTGERLVADWEDADRGVRGGPSGRSPPSSAAGSRASWPIRLGCRPHDVRDRVRGRDAERQPGRDPGAWPRACPELFGGAADLSESNLTDVKGEANFSADEAGRNLRFGVREHAMGGIANGIAYHGGFIPYVATFLTFSDYMRGVRAAVGARRAPRDRRLDARLRRARRGRPDAPAGRALRRAAGDPEPVVRPAGRRQRDGGGVGAGRGAARRTGRARPDPPEAPDPARDHGAGARRASLAAATCCARRAAARRR